MDKKIFTKTAADTITGLPVIVLTATAM